MNKPKLDHFYMVTTDGKNWFEASFRSLGDGEGNCTWFASYEGEYCYWLERIMSDWIAREYAKKFNPEDLHGKDGKIMVGVDTGKEEKTIVTTFHCDDGNVYVISVDSGTS